MTKSELVELLRKDCHVSEKGISGNYVTMVTNMLIFAKF